VAKDLILTARHALYPEERDEDYPIEVRWRYPGVDQSKWWPVEGIAWDGGEAYDVALIKSAFPEVVEGRGSLSQMKPDDNMSWVSEGFAKAGGKNQGIRRTVPMKGGVFSASDSAKTFQLHNEAPPDDESGWQGASGSPVFVNQWIIGVVITCYSNFNAARLRATPMWQLLQDEHFRKIIGFDDMRHRRMQFEQPLIKVLRQSAQAVKALEEQIVELDFEIPACEEKQRTRCLVGRLLDLDIADAIKVCKDARKSLLEEDRLGDAQAISRVIQWVLPAIYDFGVVETVRSRKFDISTALVALPAGIRTVAEIIMAGVDRRQTEYRSNVGDERFPEGRYSLPSMPEMGFDPDGDVLKEAWHTHIIDQFRPESAKEFRNAWHNYMTKHFVDTEARARQRKPEQLITLAADELAYQAEEEGKTYYFIVDIPANAAEVVQESQLTLMSVIRELKAQYPAVVFLSLSDDFILERSERKRYRSLSPMLPKDTENKS
jgi:hypothetical protein